MPSKEKAVLEKEVQHIEALSLSDKDDMIRTIVLPIISQTVTDD